MADEVAIELENGARISGLWRRPDNARACVVLAHGAGAGMRHKAMSALADGLAAHSLAVLRYNFLYMEQGGKRPDPPRLAHAAVRTAIAKATQLAPDLPLFAGGRSFGGRMTSQAQASAPLPGVRGLVFVGFPLHPAKKPSRERADHLAELRVPMLFLQGTRDALAELALLEATIATLAPLATLIVFDDADHSFHVPARSGRTDAEVHDAMLKAIGDWISDTLR